MVLQWMPLNVGSTGFLIFDLGTRPRSQDLTHFLCGIITMDYGYLCQPGPPVQALRPKSPHPLRHLKASDKDLGTSE